MLQNARLYGRLNDYFASAVARYPDRFIGLADVDEPNAHTQHESRPLAPRRRGRWACAACTTPTAACSPPATPMPSTTRCSIRSGTRSQRSASPSSGRSSASPIPTDPALLLREIERLNGWLERWPDDPERLDARLRRHNSWPTCRRARRLLRHEQLSVEILYPIHWARQHEYPFPELRPALARSTSACGAARLIWGSDMPNVERNCTYRQSLHYLRLLADGLVPPGDLERILGLNVLRVLGVGA